MPGRPLEPAGLQKGGREGHRQHAAAKMGGGDRVGGGGVTQVQLSQCMAVLRMVCVCVCVSMCVRKCMREGMCGSGVRVWVCGHAIVGSK